MKDKGSITIYLALVMSVLLSVIAAGLYSLKVSTARLEMVSAVDLGLYSLFGQYDRELMEQYHLLFADGGIGQETLQMGQVLNRLKAGVADNIREAEITGSSINGYTLATDGNGQIFKDQAVDYMEKTLGAHGVQLILNRAGKENEVVAAQEKIKDQSGSDEALAEYERIKDENTPEVEEGETEQPVVDGSFINPIEVIKDIKKMGVLKLVLPSHAAASGKKINLSQVVSKRKLEQGMGVISSGGSSDTLQGNLLFQEYIIKCCSNYTNNAQEGGLAYQVEYILQGKDNDIENLKGVVNQLLLMRETVNVLHLMTDAAKKSQLSSTALVISTALAMPQLQPLIENVLMLCWAYGESILDVRELLAGGKTALVKDNSSWQLSIENLAHLGEGLDSFRRSSESGLDYKSYLRILLSVKNSANHAMRCMDVVELNLNKNERRFRLDSCIASLEAEIKMSISGQEFSISRSYGYDM